MTAATLTATAYSRVGLLGNPSDGYGGKALAVAIRDWSAQVTLEAADCFEIVPGASDQLRFDSVLEAAGRFADAGCEDGLRLVRAAVCRFVSHVPEVARRSADDPDLRFRVRYTTDIPRQVGLAGSSAIVVATLRALAAWFAVEIAPATLAELALAAELEDLGIAAGAMDRVIQAHQGLMWMDLREPRTPDSYRALDPGLLPPLFIAWDALGGVVSGKAHAGLRARWLEGDPEVLRVVELFRELVDEGVRCLEGGNPAGLHALFDRNFDLRARIFPIQPRDREMVEIARRHGAAAKQCGSGGAVVGLPGAADVVALEAAYRAAGFAWTRPELASVDLGRSTHAERAEGIATAGKGSV